MLEHPNLYKFAEMRIVDLAKDRRCAIHNRDIGWEFLSASGFFETTPTRSYRYFPATLFSLSALFSATSTTQTSKLDNQDLQMQEPYKLFELKYSFDALEPYIDARTVELHYAKHTKTYVDKANEALVGLQKPNITEAQAYELSKQLDDNVGGVLTHQLYFNCLTKSKETGGTGGVFPTSGPLFEAVKVRWGGFEGLKEALKKGGLSRFGSGWVFLHQDLSITTAPNQEWPRGKKPILGIDVWEHAYYLKYQNKRVEYLENIFYVIDWNYVESLFKS